LPASGESSGSRGGSACDSRGTRDIEPGRNGSKRQPLRNGVLLHSPVCPYPPVSGRAWAGRIVSYPGAPSWHLRRTWDSRRPLIDPDPYRPPCPRLARGYMRHNKLVPRPGVVIWTPPPIRATARSACCPSRYRPRHAPATFLDFTSLLHVLFCPGPVLLNLRRVCVVSCRRLPSPASRVPACPLEPSCAPRTSTSFSSPSSNPTLASPPRERGSVPSDPLCSPRQKGHCQSVRSASRRRLSSAPSHAPSCDC
jgi:hypothetical protein